MKYCTLCKEHKNYEEFTKNKNHKDGLSYWCKPCFILKKTIYRKSENGKIVTQKYNRSVNKKISSKKYSSKECVKIKLKEYQKSDKIIEYKKEYFSKEENKIKARIRVKLEKHRKKRRQYRKTLIGRKKYAFWNNKRRAAKLKRTPKWADLKAIEKFYLECPDGMVVDHIIPLQGKNISGFHILENLQYLTPEENCKKNNKFIITKEV